ncbi:hypothetical protein C482_11460 [Natrialba chahannaoensis JCM 10990]|uniref:HTH marR-type domain-containing protein n=1 Tax=Natrialba chahannaoensis JCM 10990 TaxID=1227492 RepID=M0AL90_9EURY|nr:hypothetical protein [Natrialba chahannaoensis]ELY98692.1 hypothetical protein C482_11460 [Natrialba chahannaoensis JCM 10990]
MTRLSSQDRSILAVLDSAQPATVAELAAVLESRPHPMTVERRCQALQQAGYLNRGPGGAYRLTRAGASRRQTAAD